MCSMIGMETGSRIYLKYRTVVRILKRLPCKCSVHEFTHDINVGFLPVSYCVYKLASFPPPPVFDHSQHTNTEGEGLGDLAEGSAR